MSWSKTAPTITFDELKAALRFCETCEDDQDYDVPKSMMHRLETLGLVRHCGRGVFEGLPLLDELEAEWEVTYSEPIKDPT